MLGPRLVLGLCLVASAHGFVHSPLQGGLLRSSSPAATRLAMAPQRPSARATSPSMAMGLPGKGFGAALGAAMIASIPALPAGAVEQIYQAASSSNEMREVGVYLAKTLIAWGVPVVSVGFVALFVISAASSSRRRDADEEGEGSGGGPLAFLDRKKPGEPVEFLKVERINDKLDSFQYSLMKAEQGKKIALNEKRRLDFERAYGVALSDVTQEKTSKLLKAHSQFEASEERLSAQVDELSRELRALAAASANQTEGAMGGMMSRMGAKDKMRAAEKSLEKAMSAKMRSELEYIAKISEVLSVEERDKFVALVKARKGPAGWSVENPLTLNPEEVVHKSPRNKPHVFVLSFPGDVTASQVAGLREEVTAIIGWANATRGDEVMLVLNSGGGTVTGYGLAAAQLTRLKTAGLKLTVCVEQVAASGGYMMACVGDTICASPFAVIGSIGVITEQPNVYERLKKEGIEFNTVTAGKFKRTLTPTKKPTQADIDKTKEDIEQVLVLFKEFVNSQRPSLDIENVATGETWFGPDALKRKLVDELITADDKLLQYRKDGRELLSVTYSDPKSRRGGLGALLPAGQFTGSMGDVVDVLSGLVTVAKMAREGRSLGAAGRDDVGNRYMAMDRSYEDYQ